jgi:hypothetical protein
MEVILFFVYNLSIYSSQYFISLHSIFSTSRYSRYLRRDLRHLDELDTGEIYDLSILRDVPHPGELDLTTLELLL